MSKILTINNVRAYIDENGVAQLNLEDCARGLGFTQVKNGTEYVKWERVYGYISNFPFSPQVEKDDFIPENIFYRLAMKANNETAEKFQSIVCDEILPQIRKAGSYTNIPQTYAEALRLAADQAEQIEQQKAQLIEAQPKLEFFEAVAGSKDAISINEVAKVLAIKNMGRNKLFEFLRNNKILMNNNQPYQKYVDFGYFRVIEQKFNKPSGETCINIKTLVYQKGVDYIRKLVENKEDK